MQIRCTPLELPIEWGRYTSQAQEVVVVALNAGDLLQPSWYEAVFDLEVFNYSWGTRREVHAIVSEAEGLQTIPLAQWVTTIKPSLRGNAKGVLYYDTCGKWCRLQALLDERFEVGPPCLCDPLECLHPQTEPISGDLRPAGRIFCIWGRTSEGRGAQRKH